MNEDGETATTREEEATRQFAQHRKLLIGVAYRVLGSMADAEDAWLRWAGTHTAEVIDPRAFLVTVTSRLVLDRLRRFPETLLDRGRQPTPPTSRVSHDV